MSWFGKMFKAGEKKDDVVDQEKQRSAKEDEKPIEGADEVLPEHNRSLLLQLIKQNGLSAGMDLSKVTLPSFILEPRSMLEKLGDTCVHVEIFQDIPKGKTPEERIKNVVKWYMSAYHKRPKGVKKPFNPILGETFAATFQPTAGVDATPVTYVSEQVSHHPPVSAFYAQDEAKTVVMLGHFAPKSKFLGNSAATIPGGGFRIYLPEHNETYFINWPSVFVRGVLFGTLLMEIGGPVQIRCPQTGYHSDIDFVVKGYFSGSYNAVNGTIFTADQPNVKGTARDVLYTVEGNWHKQVYLKVPKQGGETTLLFDFENTPFSSSVVISDEVKADPNSSIGLWKDCAAAISKNDQESSTKHKTAIEQAQRDLRAQRKEEGIEFEPKLFSSSNADTEEFCYVGPDAVKLPHFE